MSFTESISSTTPFTPDDFYPNSVESMTSIWKQIVDNSKNPNITHQDLIKELKNEYSTQLTKKLEDRGITSYTLKTRQEGGLEAWAHTVAQHLGGGKIRTLEEPEPKQSLWQRFIGAGSKLTQKLRQKVFPTLAKTLPLATATANAISLGVTKVLSLLGIMKKPTTITGALQKKRPKLEFKTNDPRSLKTVDEMIDAAKASIGGFDDSKDIVPGYINIGKLLMANPNDPNTLLQQSNFGDMDPKKLSDIRDKISKDLPNDLKKKINNRGFFEDKSSGFHASLFMKPDGRIFISYEGSAVEPNNFRRIITTWGSNAAQMIGYTPPIYKQAADLALTLQKAVGEDAILAGHSLGGGLASYAGQQTFMQNGIGLRAYAFNAASMSDFLKNNDPDALYPNVVNINVRRKNEEGNKKTGEALSQGIEKRRYKLFPVGQVGFELKVNTAPEDISRGTVSLHSTKVALRSLELLRSQLTASKEA